MGKRVSVPGEPDSDEAAVTETAATDPAAATDEAPAKDVKADEVADVLAPRQKGPLPHPATVDARKITRSVLTTQGWVAPDWEGRDQKAELQAAARSRE